MLPILSDKLQGRDIITSCSLEVSALDPLIDANYFASSGEARTGLRYGLDGYADATRRDKLASYRYWEATDRDKVFK